MSLSDPIGDMIARVKNAQARYHKKVELPSSNFKSKIADILKNEGFIKDFKVSNNEKKNTGQSEFSAFEDLEIFNPLHHLNYFSKESLIKSVKNNMDVKMFLNIYILYAFLKNKLFNFKKKIRFKCLG